MRMIYDRLGRVVQVTDDNGVTIASIAGTDMNDVIFRTTYCYASPARSFPRSPGRRRKAANS